MSIVASRIKIVMSPRMLATARCSVSSDILTRDVQILRVKPGHSNARRYLDDLVTSMSPLEINERLIRTGQSTTPKNPESIEPTKASQSTSTTPSSKFHPMSRELQSRTAAVTNILPRLISARLPVAISEPRDSIGELLLLSSEFGTLVDETSLNFIAPNRQSTASDQIQTKRNAGIREDTK